MPRNACTRHPRKDVIEIPEGSRYCKRCHHLVPPESKIVMEMPLEAEIEVVQPETVVEVPEGATVTTSTETPVEAKPEASTTDDARPLSETEDQSTSATETPVEPELTEETAPPAEVQEEAVEAEIEASVPEEKEPEETVVEAESEATEEELFEEARKAQIEVLKAQLAELEKTE